MSKEKPIRNRHLSPAGLSAGELHRHHQGVALRGLAAPTAARDPERCAYVTSHGGVDGCGDAPYLEGFCRFHHECLVRREISPLGRILDVVRDQARRRQINQHGLNLSHRDRLLEDPLTGADDGGRA